MSTERIVKELARIEIAPQETTILVVDDEQIVRELLSELLESADYNVVTADCGENALVAIDRVDPRVVFVDKNLPDISGVEVIERGKKLAPETEFIMVTGYASLESAVDVLRAGAFDYISKPLADINIIRERVRAALARNLSVFKHRMLKEQLERTYDELSTAQADLFIRRQAAAKEGRNPDTTALRTLLTTLAEQSRTLATELSASENGYIAGLAGPVAELHTAITSLVARLHPVDV